MKTTQTLLKSFLLLSLLIVAGGISTSCVKQKNCDVTTGDISETGILICYEHPCTIRAIITEYDKVTACFIPDGVSDSLIDIVQNTQQYCRQAYYIRQTLPATFHKGNIYENVYIVLKSQQEGINTYDGFYTYQILCVE